MPLIFLCLISRKIASLINSWPLHAQCSELGSNLMLFESLFIPPLRRFAGETTRSQAKWLEFRCVWADRSGTKRSQEQQIAKSKLHPGDVTRCVRLCERRAIQTFVICALCVLWCKQSVIYCIAGGGRCAFSSNERHKVSPLFAKWIRSMLIAECSHRIHIVNRERDTHYDIGSDCTAASER